MLKRAKELSIHWMKRGDDALNSEVSCYISYVTGRIRGEEREREKRKGRRKQERSKRETRRLGRKKEST